MLVNLYLLFLLSVVGSVQDGYEVKKEKYLLKFPKQVFVQRNIL